MSEDTQKPEIPMVFKQLNVDVMKLMDKYKETKRDHLATEELPGYRHIALFSGSDSWLIITFHEGPNVDDEHPIAEIIRGSKENKTGEYFVFFPDGAVGMDSDIMGSVSIVHEQATLEELHQQLQGIIDEQVVVEPKEVDAKKYVKYLYEDPLTESQRNS